MAKKKSIRLYPPDALLSLPVPGVFVIFLYFSSLVFPVPVPVLFRHLSSKLFLWYDFERDKLKFNVWGKIMEFWDSEMMKRFMHSAPVNIFLRIRNVDIVLLQRSVTWFLSGKMEVS